MRELLFSITKKDFDVDYFSGTGAGGQYRNKHQNCVRLRHRASGAIATGQSHRSRQANLKEAISSLLKNPKFKCWHSREVYKALSGKSIEEEVKEMMAPENLKIEGKNEFDQWVEIDY